MKILVNEEQYYKLIKEDIGVCRICVTYSNIILNKLSPYIDGFINNKTPKKHKIKINLSELRDAWVGDVEGYIDFPISEIRIDFTTHLISSEKITGNFATGGAADQITSNTSQQTYITRPPKDLPKYIKEEIDSTINVKFEFDLYVTEELNNTEKNEIIYDMRDTILHETNHMLEMIKRHEKGLGYINVALGVSGKENIDVPEDIFSIWEEFLIMVYYSEPHEMRAMVQEMYSVRLRNSFEKFKEHRYYIASQLMQEFDAETMFDLMIEKIKLYNPDSLLSILTNLWKWFIQDYYATLNTLQMSPNKKIEDSKHVLGLMKVLQPRINKAGKLLQKKFNKLYSIEIE